MYVDLNVSFIAGGNEYAYLVDTRDIVKSLERLFNTRPGSVPFNRNYGSSLWSLLFENEDLETYQIAMLIYQEIQKYEPRVKMSPSDVILTKEGEHSYSIDVTFRVPSLNNVVGQVTSTITE